MNQPTDNSDYILSGMLSQSPPTTNLPLFTNGSPHTDGAYSDGIDSDVEDRLYSLVHHTNSVMDTLSSSLLGPSTSSVPSSSSYQNFENQFNNSEKSLDTSQNTNEAFKLTPIQGIKRRQVFNSSYSDDSEGVNDEPDDDDGNDSAQDLWRVDIKDILTTNPAYGKRYQTKIYCSRCRKYGNHPVKLCHINKFKVCYICGCIGHLGHYCKNQVCFKCLEVHRPVNCKASLKHLFCDICRTRGHKAVQCPSHWRKYSNITDPNADPNLNSPPMINRNKSCSLCANSHFSFECRRYNKNRLINNNYSGASFSSEKSPKRKCRGYTITSPSFSPERPPRPDFQSEQESDHGLLFMSPFSRKGSSSSHIDCAPSSFCANNRNQYGHIHSRGSGRRKYRLHTKTTPRKDNAPKHYKEAGGKTKTSHPKVNGPSSFYGLSKLNSFPKRKGKRNRRNENMAGLKEQDLRLMLLLRRQQ